MEKIRVKNKNLHNIKWQMPIDGMALTKMYQAYRYKQSQRISQYDIEIK